MSSRSETFPGFLDWVVTLCEFASCFAVVVSFFNVSEAAATTLADSKADEWLNKRFVMDSTTTVWIGCVVFVLLPRLGDCCCDRDMRLLHHPNFPASMQIWKLVIFGTNFYAFKVKKNADDVNEYDLKGGKELLASIILATCDFLISANTVLSTFFGGSKDLAYTHRGTSNPRPRLSRAWIFVNLWKDFGILSTFVAVDELYILVFEIPATIFGAKALAEGKITSQRPLYHAYRLLLVVAGALGLYLGSLSTSTSYKFVSDMAVPAILIVCEGFLACCEVINGANSRWEDSRDLAATA